MKGKIKLPDPKKALKYFEDKLAFTTGPVELNRWINEKSPDVNVVDVRRAEHFAENHIPGAVNKTKDQWGSTSGLVKNKLNVLYCYTQTCHLAAAAAAQFAAKGYSVMELEGGFKAWEDNELPVESGPVGSTLKAKPSSNGE